MAICTCERHCHGYKEVSDRTWRQHRQFRLQIETYDEFLAECHRLGINADDDPDAQDPPPPFQFIHRPRRTRKRRRIATDISGDEREDRALQASGSGSQVGGAGDTVCVSVKVS